MIGCCNNLEGTKQTFFFLNVCNYVNFPMPASSNNINSSNSSMLLLEKSLVYAHTQAHTGKNIEEERQFTTQSEDHRLVDYACCCLLLAVHIVYIPRNMLDKLFL